jgi:hypothetical protein
VDSLASIRSNASWSSNSVGRTPPRPAGHLGSAIDGADPPTVDPHPAATQGDLARLGTVADRGPVGLVTALGADQPLDVSGQ